MSEPTVHIAAFYRFQPLAADNLAHFEQAISELATREQVMGLLIMAPEGLNGTVASLSRASLESWLASVAEILGFPKFEPKWSESDAWPFRKFKIHQRSEIVTLGKPEVQPLNPNSHTHLSPQEWQAELDSGKAVVIDTRNTYETEVGQFKNAIDPKLSEFHEWPEYVKSLDVQKDQKILIYCTGGIRCEKAIVEMNSQGFLNVFQLDGGILNYLKEFPNRSFEGECFVFDNRVAVDQNLQPSQTYKLCPHCGQAASETIECERCESQAQICSSCLNKGECTCSKNCAHHHRLAPEKKGRNQGIGYRFQKTLRRIRSHT